MERLMARLDLTKYDREAPLDESESSSKESEDPVKPAYRCTCICDRKTGDKVTKGQMIAEPGKGLECGHPCISIEVQ